jgi:hypothetical protein
LEQIDEKLNRADEHIAQLERLIEAFFKKTRYGSVRNCDSHSAEAFYRYWKHKEFPIRFSTLCGEAIHQIRSSLDYILNALILRDGGSPTTATQFPIFQWRPRDKDQRRRWNAQIGGIKRVRVLAIIKRHQPYQRRQRHGNHWLAVMKHLNNRDKHSALIFHAAQVDPRLRYDSAWGEGFTGSFVGRDDGTPIPDSYTDPSGKFVRVMNVERTLTARVTFDQWGEGEGNTGRAVEVVSGLRAFRRGTAEIVRQLAPFLRPKRTKR